MNHATELPALLVVHAEWLRAFLENHARGLFAFETLDDLVQGTHARALAERERFAYRGEPEFRAWLATLARRHVADRADHYKAGKRCAARVLRLTLSDRDHSAAGATSARLPASSKPGPSTLAERKELVVLAIKAMAALPPRDRDLVRWTSEGVPLQEQAERLGIAHDAAQRAAHRAFDRLRRLFELARRASGGDAFTSR
ncbi:MAG: hypothetical protein HZB39_04290 [Planctomycetes bacterium]|nr:hypothetical protein [Planctomycetota bacterium]